MRKLVTGCYAAMLVLSAALPAVASQTAPRYQSSEPSDDSTVHEPPDRVEATFDQPLDESSQLLIHDECGRRIDGRATKVEGNSMSTALTKKPSGEYHVEYKAVGVGGVTGTGKGHFMFTVHGGKACDGKKKHDHHGNNDDDKNKGHNGHENNRHEDGNHGSNDHDSGEHETTEHSSGEDHETHTAAGGDDTHSDHDMATGGGGHDGDKNNHAGHGNDDGDSTVASGDVPGITSNDTSRKLLSRADSGTLLLSLGLCLALGVLGGAILRASGAR